MTVGALAHRGAHVFVVEQIVNRLCQRPRIAERKQPPAVVGKISKDFTRALQDKQTVDRLTTLGNELNIMTPPVFAKFVRQQIQEFAQVVKAAGITPQ